MNKHILVHNKPPTSNSGTLAINETMTGSYGSDIKGEAFEEETNNSAKIEEDKEKDVDGALFTPGSPVGDA